MDWDDEELSTQIYDRPEDRTPGPSSGPLNPPVFAQTVPGMTNAASR